MGLLDKMLGAMKYDDEDEYEDDYYDDDYDDKSSSRLVNKRAVKSQMLDDDEDDAKAKAPARSTPRNGRNRMMSNGMEVCVIKPIDFTSGSTYAIGGNLQKISHYIFILTPKNVDVSGDFQEILSGAFDVPALNNKF